MKKLLTIVINDAQNKFRVAEPVFLSNVPMSGCIGPGMIVNAKEETPSFTAEQVEWLKRRFPAKNTTTFEIHSFYHELEMVTEEDVQPE